MDVGVQSDHLRLKLGHSYVGGSNTLMTEVRFLMTELHFTINQLRFSQKRIPFLIKLFGNAQKVDSHLLQTADKVAGSIVHCCIL